MKKWLGTAFLFSGAVIGAGMMTGTEIKKYFGSGYLSLIGIILSCILMSVMIYIITEHCVNNRINVKAGEIKCTFSPPDTKY